MPKSKVKKKHPQPRAHVESAEEYARGNLSRYPRDKRFRSPSGAGMLVDFDDWLTAKWILRWTLLVCAAAVGATVILAFVVGADERDARVYQNAPVCASGQSAGCLVEIPVTIQDRGQTGGKSPIYYVDLAGTAPAEGEVDLPGQTALWSSVSARDTGTAIVWNGAVVRIDDDNGVDGDTGEAPGVRTVLVQGLLISGVVWILATAVFAARIAQADRGREAGGWTRLLVPLEIPALLAMIFFPVGALIGQEHESLTVSVGIGAGLTAAAVAFPVCSWLRNR
jgi:hypothetical protein